MKRFYQHLPIILILILAAFLRFKTTPTLMTFTPDEAYQAYIAQTIIKDFHIIWIGLSAGSFDLFLGPFWIYIISPLLSFTNGNPVILGYFGSLIGVVSTFLLYYLGLNMFNKKTAIIASSFYATLPLIIYYDQKPYPTGISFLAILIILSIYMTKKSKYWWIVFAFAYGMVFHIHLSLLPLIFLAIYWALKHKKTLDKKVIILSLLAFTVMVSPLIMFDYFHKGSNITALFVAFKASHANQLESIQFHSKTLINSIGRVWYMPQFKNSTDEILWPCTFTPTSTFTKSLPIFSIFGLFVLIYFSFKENKEKREEQILLTLAALLSIIPFIISKIINPVEYYLLVLFPIVFLMTGNIIETSNKKIKPYLYTGIVLLCMLGITSAITAKGDFGLETKRTLITKVMQVVGNNPYSLYEEGDCHQYEGWRYLFSVYARKPEQSSDDPIFGWLYKDELSQKIPNYKIIIKETRSLKPIDSKYLTSINEGGFTAYIYNNKPLTK